MKRFFAFYLTTLFISPHFLFAQEDAKTILKKSFYECMNLKGGSYKMTISEKSFRDSIIKTAEAECKFLRVSNDTANPWKFLARINSGDGILCTHNDRVDLKAADSAGVIYSREHDQSEYISALQSKGLYPPFFMAQTVFNMVRLGENTTILRLLEDKQVMGRTCYNLHIIDLSRFTRPSSEKGEKVFLIDKQTYLPVEYSETNTARAGNDSLTKSISYKFADLNTKNLPHDSVFIYKNIPPHFRLRNMTGSVFHHHLKTGMQAPVFAAGTLGGDSVSLQSLKGKNVLLYFFSQSSYPSLKSLNAIQHLQDKNKNAEVILVSIDPGRKDLADLLKRRNITLKAIARGGRISDDYFITALPTFVIIDRNGMIKQIELGFGDGTEQRLKIEN